jgi:peptidylprolyl isomerase
MHHARLAITAALSCVLALQCADSLATDATTTAPAKPASKYKSAQEILDASPKSDWHALDPNNTLYLELATGRVIIELAPDFAPQHAANIRTLAHAGYWNGLSINRSQDNFVVQWGDPESGEKDAKPLGDAKPHLPAEFSRPAKDLAFTRLPDVDGWAPQVGFAGDFPVARDPREGQAWLTHCYGMVGAGRDTAPDSSIGNELYVVDGQAPRQLDRNITVVGRVVQGMELLSVLPRGTAALGFYEKPEQRVAIKSIRLVADVPESERTPLEMLRTDSATFTQATEARRNRRDGWYVRPAGHIDLCNVPLPARAPPSPSAVPAAATSH